jgi:hypothetical protein
LHKRGKEGVVCKYYGDKYRYVFQWARVKSNGDPVLKVYIPEKNQQEPTIDMNDYNLMRDK